MMMDPCHMTCTPIIVRVKCGKIQLEFFKILKSLSFKFSHQSEQCDWQALTSLDIKLGMPVRSSEN